MPKYFSESKCDLEHKPTKSFVAAKQESLIRSDWLDNFSTFKWAMNLKSLWKHKMKQSFGVLVDEGFWLNVLYLVSNTFQVGLGPHLGALICGATNRAKRIQGSTMGPWGRCEMGDDTFIPVCPMVQKYQLRCFFCCPSSWRPGPRGFLMYWFTSCLFLGYCGYCVSDPRTFHQIFVNPEIDMRYKLNNLRCFFLGP